MFIDCEDCGMPYETSRRNTKYCSLCRALRDMKFVASRTKACMICEAEFAPINTHDQFCGACALVFKSRPFIECGSCHEHDHGPIAGLRVCNTCIRDPKQRTQMMLWLTKRIKYNQSHPDEYAQQMGYTPMELA